MLNKDGSPAFTWDPPPADLVANTKALLRQGKPMIFLHHASASWAHSWPEFTEVMGIACDWGQPLRVRNIDHPKSGYFQNTKQRITVVDKAHPITQGLGDGFEIVDEAYNCPIFEDSVHPLLRTDFTPKDVALNLNPKSKFSNLAAWVKTAENSPIVYIQLGHDRLAWENPGVPHAARQRDSSGRRRPMRWRGRRRIRRRSSKIRREAIMKTTLLKQLMVVAVGGLFVASAASTQLAGQARSRPARRARRRLLRRAAAEAAAAFHRADAARSR